MDIYLFTAVQCLQCYTNFPLVSVHGLLIAAAPVLWNTGLVVPRHVRSSQSRGWTGVPCLARVTLNHWATKEVPRHLLSNSQIQLHHFIAKINNSSLLNFPVVYPDYKIFPIRSSPSLLDSIPHRSPSYLRAWHKLGCHLNELSTTVKQVTPK